MRDGLKIRPKVTATGRLQTIIGWWVMAMARDLLALAGSASVGIGLWGYDPRLCQVAMGVLAVVIAILWRRSDS